MMNTQFTFSKGPAASNTYLKDSAGATLAQLTFDWSYNSVYFKYGSFGWVTVDLCGSDSVTIDTAHRSVFRQLMDHTIEKIGSSQDTKDLQALRDLI